jgi:hypothetical protein
MITVRARDGGREPSGIRLIRLNKRNGRSVASTTTRTLTVRLAQLSQTLSAVAVDRAGNRSRAVTLPASVARGCRA